MVENTDIPSFGFTGGLASGKTTYRNCLKDSMERELSITVYGLTFTTKITSITRDLFGIDVDEKVFREKYRRLTQDVANKMREVDIAVWTNYLIRDIKANSKVPFIIDNIRSKDEVIAFRRTFPNFIVIRLKTDEKQRAKAYKNLYGRYYTEEEKNDLTERTIADVPEDIVWLNTYKKENMEKQVVELVKAIKDGTLQELIKH